MAKKTNQQFQNDQAARELRAKGYTEVEIAELARNWDEHAARYGLAPEPTPRVYIAFEYVQVGDVTEAAAVIIID